MNNLHASNGEVGMTSLIHVMGALSDRGAGVSRAVWEMTSALADIDSSSLKVHLAGIADHDWRGIPPLRVPESLSVHPFKIIGPSPPAYSRELGQILDRASKGPSVIHSHGMWLHPNWRAASFASQKNRPLIISPHGMLCPWSFRHSQWKKLPIFHLIESHNLNHATCLLASSKREALDIGQFQFATPIATIPFGLNLEEFQNPRQPDEAMEVSWDSFIAANPGLRGRRFILFLGRIHPVKAPEHLISAFASALGSSEDFHLILAGPSDDAIKTELIKQATKRSIANRITFAGAISGAFRLALLRKSSVLVLCSHNENFGYVVPEALASGTPVVVSDRTPWAEVGERGCGWSYPHGEDGLSTTFQELAKLTPEELRAMGLLGREWIEQDFAWKNVAGKLVQMYRWTLDGGPAPDFVEMPA